MAAPIPPLLKEQFPEVEEYVRIANISWDPKVIVEYGDKAFNEDQFLMVDPSFFTVFDYKLISGSEGSVLSDIYSAVITVSNAEKYFGEEDPVGTIIRVDGEYDFEITGVITDPPFNSHFEYDFLISFENLERMYGKGSSQSWGGFNYFAYLLLKENVNWSVLEKKIKEIKLEVRSGYTVSFGSLVLQPLTDIHFQSNRGNQKPAYNMSYIYIFLAIALAVLVIASINFINLTTARSEKRIKEIGLRKTIGASRRQLIFQLISESIFVAFIAMLIANILLLIISSLIIFKQLNYVYHTDLGLDKEHVVNVSVYGKADSNKINLFKEEVKNSPHVL